MNSINYNQEVSFSNYPQTETFTDKENLHVNTLFYMYVHFQTVRILSYGKLMPPFDRRHSSAIEMFKPPSMLYTSEQNWELKFFPYFRILFSAFPYWIQGSQ